MSKRKCPFTELASKKICKIFKMIGTLKIFFPLETYTPLSRNFNNITRWLNLTDVNLSNNRVGELPAQLGTLPFLRRLNLSKNRIEFCYGWLWIKQVEIRKTLRDLDISNNSITELPYYIRELSALEILNISHNKLENLPHSIADMQSLKILNVSHNSLLYLSREIFRQLPLVDIFMNPCQTEDYRKSETVMIPSLAEMSAAVIQRHRIRYEKLPNSLIEYINNNVRSCAICKQYCRVSYLHRVVSCHPRHLYTYLSTCSAVRTSRRMRMKLLSVDYIRCFPYCDRMVVWE